MDVRSTGEYPQFPRLSNVVCKTLCPRIFELANRANRDEGCPVRLLREPLDGILPWP